MDNIDYECPCCSIGTKDPTILECPDCHSKPNPIADLGERSQMTKKDYIAIAKILHEEYDHNGSLIERLIEYFSSENPRFDEFKFRKAAWGR